MGCTGRALRVISDRLRAAARALRSGARQAPRGAGRHFAAQLALDFAAICASARRRKREDASVRYLILAHVFMI